MRKLLYIMAGVILTIGLSSCEKQDKDSPEFPGQGAVKAEMITVVTPDYDGSSGPYLIPAADGKDRGGNRTCVDVYAAFPDVFDGVELTDCGSKVDVDDDYEGPIDGFPFDVWVNPDGTVGFAQGDDFDCLIWAAIIKGSNNANVYVFDGGVGSADNLASPAFADGRIPWVSNITFCCACDVPDDEDEYIAIKVVWDGGFAMSAADATHGSTPWSASTEWCSLFGVNPYPDVTSIDLISQGGSIIGEAVVNGEGDVTITMDDVDLDIGTVYIYVGEMIAPSSSCPTYTAWDDFTGDWDNVANITW